MYNLKALNFVKKYFKTNKDRKIEGLIFIFFFIVYLTLGMFLSYFSDLTTNDIIFGSDINRVEADLGDVFRNHYRTKVHPLFVLFFQPIVLILNGLISNTTLTCIILSSIVSAISVAIVYKIGTLYNISTKYKIIISLVFGFTFSNIVFSAIIETYCYSQLFLLLLWYYVAKIFKNKVNEKNMVYYLSILGLCNMSVTVTNYVVFIIATIILLLSNKLKAKSFLIENIITLVLCVFLSFYQNMIWHNTAVILDVKNNSSGEVEFIGISSIKANLKNVINNMYLNGFISSDIYSTNFNENIYKTDTTFYYFSDKVQLFLIISILFYMLVLYYTIRNFKNNVWMNIGLLLTLIFNTTLHFIYGNSESFLYSQNLIYLPFLLLIINFGEIKSAKVEKVNFIILVAILLCEITKNLKEFFTILKINEKILPRPYFTSHFSNIELILFLLFFVIFVSLIFFLIIKAIQKLINEIRNKDIQILNIVGLIALVILLKTVFIGISITPNYGNFMGFNISEKIQSTTITNDLKRNFSNEYKSYQNYLKEYETFVKNHDCNLTNVSSSKNFYFFGMGNRKKIIFNTNRLNDIENKKVIKKWNVKDFLVIPNEYTVIIQTIDNHFIKIYENEDGIFINDNNTTEALDNTKINLKDFSNGKYPNVEKVLYSEILFNIKDSKPIPNILVYDDVWYRDAALAAMVLKNTNNTDLIEKFIDNIENVYDNQNGASEPDNLGELLYIISTSENEHKELVNKIIAEANRLASENKNGNYISGLTDGSVKEVYQNKWYDLGISKLSMVNNLNKIWEERSGEYNQLTWWNEGGTKEYRGYYVGRHFQYLGIAQYHYFKKVPFYANSNIYPLSYEMCGSKANFESTKMLDESYYINNRIAPTHLWSASEMLLLIMDEEGTLNI